jgi:hypothetical protein
LQEAPYRPEDARGAVVITILADPQFRADPVARIASIGDEIADIHADAYYFYIKE